MIQRERELLLEAARSALAIYLARRPLVFPLPHLPIAMADRYVKNLLDESVQLHVWALTAVWGERLENPSFADPAYAPEASGEALRRNVSERWRLRSFGYEPERDGEPRTIPTVVLELEKLRAKLLMDLGTLYLVGDPATGVRPYHDERLLYASQIGITDVKFVDRWQRDDDTVGLRLTLYLNLGVA